jgi:hypothetical protein
MARVGGQGIGLRPARDRQRIERVQRLPVGVEYGQSFTAQPKPAVAVLCQVRHRPAAGNERWHGDPSAVDREGSEAAVGGQQHFDLGRRDRVAYVQALAVVAQREDIQPRVFEAGTISEMQ